MEYFILLFLAAAWFVGVWRFMGFVASARTNRARRSLEAQRRERQRLAQRVRLHLDYPAFDVEDVIGSRRGD